MQNLTINIFKKIMATIGLQILFQAPWTQDVNECTKDIRKTFCSGRVLNILNSQQVTKDYKMYYEKLEKKHLC